MKTSNFKKVLALVLSLAMILSVCTMGFTVNAETAEVDLSYCIVNDTAMKSWRADNENMALANYDGKTVYRIAPQKASTGLLPFSSKVDLTASQAASINTVAYFVSNEFGSDLEVGFQYYGSNGACNAFLGGGYVYLLDDKTGDILPVYATKGYATIPAGFKGYVVYDLSNADNYGNGDWEDSDGNPVKSVNAFKDNCFKPLMIRAKYTEDMVTKAWYIGDLTVSTKSVEEFAKLASGFKVIAFNFNTASVHSYELDEAMNFWNGNGKLGSDANGRAEIVDFGGLEGKGSKFTAAKTAGGNDGKLAIRNDFVTTKNSDLPFAMENAKGIKFDIVKEGNLDFFIAFNSNKDTIAHTKYCVSNDGTVTIGDKIPANFKGTVYYVFDEKAININKSTEDAVTWAEYINSKTGDFNMSIYSGEAGLKVGDTLTIGGFGFIYDTTDFEANITPEATEVEVFNPVIFDGTEKTKNPYRADWDIAYGDHYTAVYNGSYTGTSNPNMLRMNKASARTTFDFDVSKINGFSFEFKAPDDGCTHKLTINMEHENSDVYRGQLVAIDKTGAKVATRNYQWNGGNTLNLPSGFDGIIVMTGIAGASTEQGIWVDGYFKNDGSCTNYKTFAEYYEAMDNGWYGISINVKKRLDANGAEVDFEVGTSTYEYDTLRAITQDMTEYLADLSFGFANDLANNDGYIVNNLSNKNGNTAGIYSAGGGNNVDVTYASNDSKDGSAAKITFNATHPEKGQRDHNMKVVNTAGLDLTKIKGITYRVDMENPDNVSVNWTYKINGDANNIPIVDIYAISDNGEITKFENKAIFDYEFHGNIVVILNKGATPVVAPSYGKKPTVSWEDWVTTNKFVDIRIYLSNGGNFEMTDGTLTGGYANFAMYYDDLAVLNEDAPIFDAIDAAFDTEKYINTANSLSQISGNALSKNNTAGTATYDVSIDKVAGAPGAGTAYKLTRTENPHKAGQQIFITGNSSLTKEEVLRLDAIAYWIKIPEGKKFTVSKNINAQYNKVVSSILTYNTVTGEYSSIVEGDSLTLTGFEGYIIMPLKNAIVNTENGAAPMKFSEAYGNKLSNESNLEKLGGYFYITSDWKYTATEAWIGAYQTIPSLTQFFAEIGAETKPGDANNDTEIDVRDLVRIKKYNADSKTAVAYQNMDIDGNGLIETSIDMVASRKQNIGAEYKALEIDASLAKYPDIMIGFYHGGYGVWDCYASDVAPESNVLNAYTSLDMYALSQMKQNGGAGWMYISKSFAGEPVFGTKDGGYDNTATEINEAWKTALDNAINAYKAKGVWNQVAGFHTEEILMNASKYMSQTQYAIMTKYLRDTYGKRVLAVLSVYEVVGYLDYEAGPIPPATPETYAYVTDIGFDKYGIDTDGEKTSFTNTFNAMKDNTGNRKDVKYWVLPTAYCGKTAEGTPTRTDASIAEEIGWFDDFFANTDLIPESQRGGILFYTFQTFYDGGYDYIVSAGNFGQFGLDKLIGEYNYTLTAKAIADMAARYVD